MEIGILPKKEAVVVEVDKYIILMIDAKCFVGYWQSRGDNATIIHAQLVTRFRQKAPAYASITNWPRRLHFGEDILESGIHSGKPLDRLVDFRTVTEGTAFPFDSVRTLASTLEIPRSTIWDHPQKGPFDVKYL
jgi:hypothetical protein